MKSNPYITNCPRCEAERGMYCMRPLKVGRRRRVSPPHRERLALARETRRLKLIIERRQAGYLWGQKHFFTPRLIGEVFGNVKKLIWISGLNTRPAFWVVRVDSSWSQETEESDLFFDHLEEIYQAIEGEFGTGEKEDGSLYANARFPQTCDFGSGTVFGKYTLPERKRARA